VADTERVSHQKALSNFVLPKPVMFTQQGTTVTGYSLDYILSPVEDEAVINPDVDNNGNDKIKN